MIHLIRRVLLQGLEAVLDKAVELEDGKKVSRFVKLVLSIWVFACLRRCMRDSDVAVTNYLCAPPLCFFSGIDLDTVNIIQRDALLLFRTLCKVGCLSNVTLVRATRK